MENDSVHTAAVLRTRFLAFTAVLFVVSVIYEHFGHGVWSPYMIYCWCAPLALGVLPMHLFTRKPALLPGPFSRRCLTCAAATAAVGSFMRGVLDIYGTSNRLCAVYLYAAIILLATAVIAWLYGLMKTKAGA